MIPDPIRAEGYLAAQADFPHANLGIFGLTGVGKSTLINAVFGISLAQTGIGDPVTQSASLYRVQTSNLGIFDTKGLELGSNMADIVDELAEFVAKNRLGPAAEHIHVVWYCIRAGDRRLQPAEEDFIRKLAAIGIPIIIVLTQTALLADGNVHPDARALADTITEARLPVRGGVQFVNAVGDDFAGVPSHGLPELIERTQRLVPEGIGHALASAQRVNAQLKRRQAEQFLVDSAKQVKWASSARRVYREWITLYAKIALLYDIQEVDSQAILDQLPAVQVLRNSLRYSTKAKFLVVGSPIVVAGAGVYGGAKKLTGHVRKRRKAQPDGVSGIRGEVNAESPTELVFEPEAEQAARPITAGKAYGPARVTRAIGEAWIDTCEQVWWAFYPHQPRHINTEVVAAELGVRVAARLPRRLRKKIVKLH